MSSSPAPYSTSLSQYTRTLNQSSSNQNSKSGGLSLTSPLRTRTHTSSSDVNPFALPTGNSVFMQREKDRQREKEEKEMLKTSDMWTRTQIQTSKSSKIKNMDIDSVLPSTHQRNSMLSPTHHKSGSGSKSQTPNNDASIIRGTNHNVPLTEFISKKRELFLVQMSLENKEEEIDRLEKDVKQKHEKLTTIEMTLESDALRFDKFLKENDRIAHEAMKKQEQMTREKIEASADIRRLQSELSKLDLEIGKQQENLGESLKFKAFLDSISPSDFLQQRQQKSQTVAPNHDSALELDDDQHEDHDVEELYFTQPQQMMDELARIEERNLFLIQNCQTTEEQIEELKQKMGTTRDALNQQTEQTQSGIRDLQKRMHDENMRTQKLSARVSVGYFSTYSDKIYQFLRDCINSSFSSLNLFAESTPDPVHLLSEVEKRLDSMMVEISRVDPEFRAQVEKVKDAERRERARAERLEQQRLHDEERIRRSRARAIMAGELAMKAKLKPQMFKTVLKKRGQETTQAGHDANAEEEQTKKFFAVY